MRLRHLWDIIFYVRVAFVVLGGIVIGGALGEWPLGAMIGCGIGFGIGWVVDELALILIVNSSQRERYLSEAQQEHAKRERERERKAREKEGKVTRKLGLVALGVGIVFVAVVVLNAAIAISGTGITGSDYTDGTRVFFAAVALGIALVGCGIFRILWRLRGATLAIDSARSQLVSEQEKAKAEADAPPPDITYEKDERK